MREGENERERENEREEMRERERERERMIERDEHVPNRKGLGRPKVWVQKSLGCPKAWVQGSLTGPGIQSWDSDTRVENLGSRKAREYQCCFAFRVHGGGLETGWRTLLGNVGVRVERPGCSPPPSSPLEL